MVLSDRIGILCRPLAALLIKIIQHKSKTVTESGLLYKPAGVSAAPRTEGDPAHTISHCTITYIII